MDFRIQEVSPLTEEQYVAATSQQYFPRIFNHSLAPFVMCNAPKTGSTRWVELLSILRTGRHHRLGFAHIAVGTSQHFASLKEMNELDRILIVRNPYIRFVSSYEDHMRRYPEDKNITMEGMIDLLLGGKPIGTANHLWPQSRMCGHAFGVEYHYMLRLEQMSLWYDDFRQRYNLGRYLDHGWPTWEEPFYESGIASWTNESVSAHISSVLGSTSWEGVVHQEDRKENALSENIFKKYYNPRIAEKVTRYFMEDFRLFGYPIWDGKPQHFRFQ